MRYATLANPPPVFRPVYTRSCMSFERFEMKWLRRQRAKTANGRLIWLRVDAVLTFLHAATSLHRMHLPTFDFPRALRSTVTALFHILGRSRDSWHYIATWVATDPTCHLDLVAATSSLSLSNQKPQSWPLPEPADAARSQFVACRNRFSGTVQALPPHARRWRHQERDQRNRAPRNCAFSLDTFGAAGALQFLFIYLFI